MRHCWACDREIPGTGYRRWVTTGGLGYGRVYISRRGVSGSSTGGSRTGLRTVCEICADEIDTRQALTDWFKQIFTECALIVVLGCALVYTSKRLWADFAYPPPTQTVQISASHNGAR
jgi:hypothetical protein